MHFSHAPGLYSYVKSLSALMPTQGAALTSPDTLSGDLFGNSIAVSGNYMVVGAPYKDIGAILNAGRAYVFDVTTGALVSTLSNPNAIASDLFGQAVAISGNYAVVGAYGKDTGIYDAGGAYVFDVTTGALVSTLSDPSPAASDSFGISVAIDGNYAVVGAFLKDAGGLANSGSAYVFNVTTGALVSTLVNPNPSAGDQFGQAVAISGNYAVVGGGGEDISAANTGQAYVFDVTTGALVSTLVNPRMSVDDRFGDSVAINGNYAVVGSQLEDLGASNAGVGYVFNATTGELVSTLTNPIPVADDNFGLSVAVSSDYVVVGAYRADFGATNAGRVYVFHVTTGALAATISNPTPVVAADYFGISVATDGNYVVVGATGKDVGATDTGGAYVFTLA